MQITDIVVLHRTICEMRFINKLSLLYATSSTEWLCLYCYNHLNITR